MGTLVKYGNYDIATAKKEQEQLAAEGGDFMKLLPGKNVVRILPPRVGEKSPFVVTYQHFIKDNDKIVTFTCPRMMQKKSCPACSNAERMRASGIPADRDAGFQWLPKRRVFIALIDRKQPEMGARTLAFGKMVHEGLLSLRNDEDWGDFCNPVDGYDVNIEKTGEGMKTEYKVLPRKHSPLAASPEQMNTWLEALPDMGRLAYVPSSNEIIEKLRTSGIDIDSDDEPVLPAAKRRTASDDLED